MDQADLKVTFSEILRGFSLVESPTFKTVRIKHFNNFDSAELDIKNRFFFEKAKSQGLPTRKEKIDFLIENDTWTEEKNVEILRIKTTLSGLETTKKKVFLQAHIHTLRRPGSILHSPRSQIRESRDRTARCPLWQ